MSELIPQKWLLYSLRSIQWNSNHLELYVIIGGNYEIPQIGRASCRESVDLGGRRIIKKKKVKNHHG